MKPDKLEETIKIVIKNRQKMAFGGPFIIIYIIMVMRLCNVLFCYSLNEFFF